MLSLLPFGQTGEGAPPAVAPSMASTALANAGSTGSNTVSSAGFNLPVGDDLRVIASACTGGEAGTSEISFQITGSSGPVAMTRRALTDSSNSAEPVAALEVTAIADIAEADLPGTGPYTITATCDDPDTTTRMGLSLIVIKDAPSAPSAIAFDDAAGSINILPTTPDSLVVALVGTSAYSSSLDFTSGVDALNRLPGTLVDSNPYNFGDGILIGSAPHGVTPLAIATNVVGRPAIIALAYPKG